MAKKQKRTISVSLARHQIDMIDLMAREKRVKSGENVTRSQIVRRIIDEFLHEREQQQPLSPAGPSTPRRGERSDSWAGSAEDCKEG